LLTDALKAKISLENWKISLFQFVNS
jgi:hypothetical protein